MLKKNKTGNGTPHFLFDRYLSGIFLLFHLFVLYYLVA